jgi:sulfotransferase family protein
MNSLPADITPQFAVSFTGSSDPILQRADRLYRDHQIAAHALVPAKLALLTGYDVLGMNRAATICHWGRSGSVLLASFLDDHDDIITLPNQTSEYAYPFFRDYQSLSLWEKLIAYPAYSEIKKGNSGNFFLKDNPDGNFAIEPDDYFAAVEALSILYGDHSAAELDARPRFFQFLHVAYAGALGKPPLNPRPLMISAQHWVNEELAREFIEDFPDARFLHTIRDPISAFDSWLERHFVWQLKDNADPSSGYRYPAFDAVRDLLAWDAGHRGMGARTRAIRFEDLHLAPAETMRRLADWLDVPYRPSMLESTLNGKPYVVEAGGQKWVGSNPKNARRRSKNLNSVDQLAVFTLLHRNFVEWNYPYPKFLRSALLRICIIFFCTLIPSKTGIANTRNLLAVAWGALRTGRFGLALRAPVLLVLRRLRTMWLIATQAAARTAGAKRPMKII